MRLLNGGWLLLESRDADFIDLDELTCRYRSEEYGDTEQIFEHIDSSLVGVTVKKVAI